MKIEQIKN